MIKSQEKYQKYQNDFSPNWLKIEVYDMANSQNRAWNKKHIERPAHVSMLHNGRFVMAWNNNATKCFTFHHDPKTPWDVKQNGQKHEINWHPLVVWIVNRPLKIGLIFAWARALVFHRNFEMGVHPTVRLQDIIFNSTTGLKNLKICFSKKLSNFEKKSLSHPVVTNSNLLSRTLLKTFWCHTLCTHCTCHFGDGQ